MKFRFAISVFAALAMMTAVGCGNNKGNSEKSQGQDQKVGTETRIAGTGSSDSAVTIKDERGYIVKVGDQVEAFKMVEIERK